MYTRGVYKVFTGKGGGGWSNILSPIPSTPRGPDTSLMTFIRSKSVQAQIQGEFNS